MQRVLSFIVIAVLLAPASLWAQVKLPPIDDPNFRPYPIAVPDF